ncbi:uncharacterized protein M437DRAFT_58098 [Aureobasidium melanogenum CBS 110374]|uniref:Zn(2)-C6 fungal-type domain-containing protein n=1 Tax=Aureobasidium melanogenum (strain CBS 110374) TaxID=1043003 RepID=A0A074VE88_AURM1|nr:uncharacterized protein M437DRAFT_58098 [Aureobasidium melanogenum CBS 110374]KEQ59035.1 hypothetical protein M437DRAFT_58098 [Aureobasidium melanogenum CBS 110374]
MPVNAFAPSRLPPPASASESPARDAKTSTPDGERTKPKQKRNKPTLSCEECVERKTKCDRGRPGCLACIKRQSTCRYTHVANLIADARYLDTSRRGGKMYMLTSAKARKTTDLISKNIWSSHHQPRENSMALSMAPHLPQPVPFSKQTPSNIFGIGSSHPFTNYWTCQGGLPEVLAVLPSKQQADILIAKYFECVAPVYPFLHRRTFYVAYERFWALPEKERETADADLIALHFALYAMGTQFIDLASYDAKSSSAEFLASAANQALRIYSYLNRSSLRALGAQILLCYFLMNDNHASDAYAWSGIIVRQAYALRLHRDPDIILPNISPVEKHTRRRFWQAILHQDTFLTVLLKLPPTATHSDVSIDSLTNETEVEAQDSTRYTGSTDVLYVKSLWRLALKVQENLCSPVSLSIPIAKNARAKTTLVNSFREIWKSAPSFLTTSDYETLRQMAQHSGRAVRQNLFFTSNYYHCLMIIQAFEDAEVGVELNFRGALEAAHEAIWAYFKLDDFFQGDAGVWWVFQHRAFEEALTMTDLLATLPANETNSKDQLFTKCKEAVRRMIEVLQRQGGSQEMNKHRHGALLTAYEHVTI